MRVLTSSIVLSALAGASALLAGCQSSSPSTGAAAGAPTTQSAAVACDTCETTWIKTPIYASGGRGNAGVIGYSRRAMMPCSDCVTIAKRWTYGFKNNMVPTKFEHQCKTCGGKVTICEEHRS